MRAAGKHEHHPLVGLRQHGDCGAISDALRGHGDVHPFRAKHGGTRRRTLDAADRVGPRSRGVHDGARAHFERVLAEPVAHRRAGDASALEVERGDLRVVERHGARRDRVDYVRDGEARVVRGGVEVDRAALKSLALQLRFRRQHLRGAQRAMLRDVSKRREQVVQPEAGVEFPARNPGAAIHRPGELQRPHEMRRSLEQDPALAARFEHQMKKSVFEIPHAAVHEPRRPARRAAREIVALDERDRKSPQRGVARNSRAVDPAADDEDIETLAREPLARLVSPRERGPGRGVSHRRTT